MFSTLRTRFGIPGVISVMALVFAMLGGAYAANNSSDGGKATASAKKPKKGPRGPKGPKGDTGPAGPQGPGGANGKDGANGSNGANGAPGKSVTTSSFGGFDEPAGEPCEEAGGIEMEIEGSGNPEYVCNGEEGAQGAPGSPWPGGGTLAPGATETGVYAVVVSGEFMPLQAPISFNVKLASPLDGSHVVYVPRPQDGSNPDPTHCPGSAADPQAASGYLCVYSSGTETGLLVGPSVGDPSIGGAPAGASRVGAIVGGLSSAGTGLTGTWAVTG